MCSLILILLFFHQFLLGSLRGFGFCRIFFYASISRLFPASKAQVFTSVFLGYRKRRNIFYSGFLSCICRIGFGNLLLTQGLSGVAWFQHFFNSIAGGCPALPRPKLVLLSSSRQSYPPFRKHRIMPFPFFVIFHKPFLYAPPRFPRFKPCTLVCF